MVNPLLIFLMRQSFLGLPKDLEEAAAVDGASRFRTFRQIVLPLAMTAVATQRLIPYFAWVNRAPGPMRVWIPIATEA